MNNFISALTILWECQLHQLGHSQNSIEFTWWREKNTWSLFRMIAECFWNRWNNKSNIFLAVWIKSVTMIIFEILFRLVAWLIPHLMANNSASVLMIFRAWWRVLVIGLLCIWICTMKVATLFLMLASMMMRALDGELEDSRANLSSC